MNISLKASSIRLLWAQFDRHHWVGWLRTCFIPSQLSIVCSAEFKPTSIERMLSLTIEAGTKSPLNTLQEGSVLPGNTASARKTNEPSFVDHGLNERREDDCLRIQALPREGIALKEESVQQGTGKRQERKQKQIVCLSYIYYRK